VLSVYLGVSQTTRNNVNKKLPPLNLVVFDPATSSSSGRAHTPLDQPGRKSNLVSDCLCHNYIASQLQTLIESIHHVVNANLTRGFQFWTQSYDLEIYSYNASVVVGYSVL
jgi:hypothetical protein